MKIPLLRYSVSMLLLLALSSQCQAIFTDDATTKTLLHLDDAPSVPGGFWTANLDDTSVTGRAPIDLLLDHPTQGDFTNAPTWFSNVGPDGSGALQFKGPNDPDGTPDQAYLAGGWAGDISSLSLDIAVDMQALPAPFEVDGITPADNRMTIIRALDWQLHYRSNPGQTDGFFELRWSDSGGGGFLNSQTVPGIFVWQDVNVQIRNGTASLKVGGQRTSAPLSGSFGVNASQVVVGYDFFSGRHLQGVVDEIRVATAPAPLGGGVSLFSDTFDGTDLQDFTGQTGSVSPLKYAEGGGAGSPSVTESGGTLTFDASAFGGHAEVSPLDNFNMAEIEAAGGFIVEMTDVHPNTAGPGGNGTWVGATLFETFGGNGDPLNSVYSFALRDNGESFVLSDFGGPNQIFTAVPNPGNAGGAHDIRLEVAITDFAATGGSATVEAYVDGVLEQTTLLSGLDLSNNYLFFRGVDAVSTIGGISVSLLSAAGDFDGDGDVDGNDFLTWQQGFGTTHDASDLADWEANYGNPTPLAASTASAVPEPTSAMLVLFGLGGLALVSRRTSRKA